MKDFSIIQDTHEQQPWDLDMYITGWQMPQHMATGDYTILGYENDICIERKQSPSEIATNLGKRINRFERELARMGTFRFRYIVCEFLQNKLIQFPKGLDLPKTAISNIRIGGKYLHKKLMELSEDYGIEVFFCQNRHAAEEKAMELLDEAYTILNEEKTTASD